MLAIPASNEKEIKTIQQGLKLRHIFLYNPWKKFFFHFEIIINVLVSPSQKFYNSSAGISFVLVDPRALSVEHLQG